MEGSPAISRPWHIAVFNIAAHGQVNPTLGLVRELVGRGHRVSYVTTEAFAPLVAQTGADPVVALPATAPVGTTPQALGDAASIHLSTARRTLPALTERFDRDRPDLVLYDTLAWAGAVIARRWDLPAVQLTCTHAYYDGWEEELFGTPDLSTLPVFRELEGFLAQFAPGTSVQDFLLPEHGSLVFLPKKFQRRPETVGDRHVFVGPIIEQRPTQGVWKPPDGVRPILFIALGSVHNSHPEFYRTCMEAFGGENWHVVMSIGHQLDACELPLPPSNFEIHKFVPQLDVLAHAGVFITHAGMGSTMEAVHFRVPMVAVPQMAEQRVNADQIERLGLGRHLPTDEVDTSTLRQAVLDVADDAAVAASIRAMGGEIARAGGAGRATDYVERWLSG